MPSKKEGHWIFNQCLDILDLSICERNLESVLRRAVISLIIWQFAVSEDVLLRVFIFLHTQDLKWLGLVVVILNEGTFLISGWVISEASVQIEYLTHIFHEEDESTLAGRYYLIGVFFNRCEINLNIPILAHLERVRCLWELSWLWLNGKHHLFLGDVITSQVDTLVVIHEGRALSLTRSSTAISTTLVAALTLRLLLLIAALLVSAFLVTSFLITTTATAVSVATLTGALVISAVAVAERSGSGSESRAEKRDGHRLLCEHATQFVHLL